MTEYGKAITSNCEILELDEEMLRETLVPYYDMGLSCGLPTEMGDIPPEMMTAPALLTMGLNVSFTRAQGDSMIGVDIHDGDLLVIETTSHFNNQDIVAAKINGEDLLKSYYMDEHGRHWLVPANEKYDAIMLTENMDVRFVGRMLWNMRRDVHDTTRNIRQSIERYLNKYGEPIVQEPVQQVAKIEETPRQLPPELNSRKAQRILNRAVDAQLLTADYQRPKGVEWWRMACMADAIGEELALTNKWVVFCTLWGNSNLRKYNTDKQGMTDYNNFRKILMKQII